MINNYIKHVAIIMDGNGRWAQNKSLPRFMGHKAGVESLRIIVKYSGTIGLQYLTVYAFSSENWQRPKEEIDFLMDLFRIYLQEELPFLHENNVCVSFIGRRHDLDEDILHFMQTMERETRNNTGLNLILAINYGGRNEILDTLYPLYKEKENFLSFEAFQQHFEKKISSQFPAPDLLIRTAGEKRISNFLLWHLAYSELYFTDTLWPDFNEACLEQALKDFSKRERRYGGLKS